MLYPGSNYAGEVIVKDIGISDAILRDDKNVAFTIDKNESYFDSEIIVKCKEIDDVLQDIISYIGIADKNMIGEVDGEMFFIPLNSIFYFESVDKIVYIYTDKQVYKSSAKLYILEEQLVDTYFARVSKTTILNLKKLNIFQQL